LPSEAQLILLRPWQSGDKASLVKYLNNRRVWLNVSDRIPHPYTEVHAEAWLAACKKKTALTDFAIDLHGEAIGGAGVETHSGIYRLTATIGYWLGEPFWGRGFATAVVRQLTQYCFQKLQMERLQADVFTHNRASARVLEKCGYVLEATQRRNSIKDGQILDSLLYALLREAYARDAAPYGS
jgi:ribosomal-protein-alanine N-acetyltransferase